MARSKKSTMVEQDLLELLEKGVSKDAIERMVDLRLVDIKKLSEQHLNYQNDDAKALGFMFFLGNLSEKKLPVLPSIRMALNDGLDLYFKQSSEGLPLFEYVTNELLGTTVSKSSFKTLEMVAGISEHGAAYKKVSDGWWDLLDRYHEAGFRVDKILTEDHANFWRKKTSVEALQEEEKRAARTKKFSLVLQNALVTPLDPPKTIPDNIDFDVVRTHLEHTLKEEFIFDGEEELAGFFRFFKNLTKSFGTDAPAKLRLGSDTFAGILLLDDVTQSPEKIKTYNSLVDTLLPEEQGKLLTTLFLGEFLRKINAKPLVEHMVKQGVKPKWQSAPFSLAGNNKERYGYRYHETDEEFTKIFGHPISFLKDFMVNLMGSSVADDENMEWLQKHSAFIHPRLKGIINALEECRKRRAFFPEDECEYKAVAPPTRGPYFDGWINSEKQMFEAVEDFCKITKVRALRKTILKSVEKNGNKQHVLDPKSASERGAAKPLATEGPETKGHSGAAPLKSKRKI